MIDIVLDLAVCVDLKCPRFSQYKRNNILFKQFT